MPRNTLSVGDCVFRLDSSLGFRQAFPMTFNDVGLSDDGFEFNGSSSGIDVSISSGIVNLPDEVSVEVLFKTSDNTLTWLNIIDADYGGAGTSGGYAFQQIGDMVLFNLPSSTTGEYVYSSHVLENNVFLHVVMVGKYGSYVKDYINGEEDNIEESTGTFSIPQHLRIGYGSMGYFNGTIKHVSIYNRALTPQEVADRYNEVTFQFLNDTPTPTQQNYIDFWDNRKIGRQ